MTEFEEMLRRVLGEGLRKRLLFAREPNYVIIRGSAPENTLEADTPAVLFDDGLYRVYYKGNDGVCLAESKDGKKDWTFRGLIFSAADIPWSTGDPTPSCILKVDGVYYLYYITNVPPVKIGLAKSTDGVTFTDLGTPTLEGDDYDVSATGSLTSASVYHHNGRWYADYVGHILHGFLPKHFLAVSDDGEAWSKLGETMAPDPTRDEMFPGKSSLLMVGGRLLHFYEAYRLSRQDPDPWRTCIKLASATPDFRDYVKHGVVLEAPMQRYGGGLDLDTVDDPYVIAVDGKLILYCGTGVGSGIVRAERPLDDFAKKAWFPEEEPHLPPGRVTWWRDTSISAGDTTRPAVVFGYGVKTIYFVTDTLGTLTIEAIYDERKDWEEYDTLTDVGPGPLKPPYNMVGNSIAVRLKFSVAATVSASIVMRK